MTKKVILLDMDDTINHFNTSFWQLHEEVYGEKVDPNVVNEWDLANFSSYGKKVYDLFKYPGLFRYIEPKEGAVDFVHQLSEHYEIYFVTDSPAGTSHCDEAEDYANPADDKRKWLEEHFPFVPQSHIIFCAHKWMVVGDVLIDDKPDTYFQFKKRNRNIILMDAPHNRFIETGNRARDFDEANDLLKKMFEESKGCV